MSPELSSAMTLAWASIASNPHLEGKLDDADKVLFQVAFAAGFGAGLKAAREIFEEKV